ncbi:MAG: Gfo/Idh/MocA family oxidoreductase [Verrucomicrobia bacterium]|nr:Gfo/Idh/MocA family oxidoreductase [Verrucomicrobiota bacterium]
MSSLPLSLGFIGGSLNSAVGYAHFASCMMDNQWSLVSGCFDIASADNLKTADAYGVPPDRVYARWQDMLLREKHRLDAIVVLTPTPSHCEIVTACLKEGFPTICEKALAMNSAEAEQIMKVRDAVNGFLAVSYNYSGYPMVRELRNLIRKGVLGKLLHFQVEMPQEGFIRVDRQGNKPVPQEWRLSDAQVPTIHLDLAVHLHHLIHYLSGQKPLEVVSDQGSYGWFPVIDNVTSLCRYSENLQGHIWFSKSALGHRNGLRLRIYGSEASAEWFQACPEELVLAFSNGRREIVDRASAVEVTGMQRYNRFKAGHPAGFIEALAHLYTDFADCLRQHKSTGRWTSEEVFSAELAAEGLRMFEAMVSSVHSKSWQEVK